MESKNIGQAEFSPAPSRWSNPQFVRVVQLVSWFVTAIFIVALVIAIYQAVVQGNPLPLWAWIGMIALLAAVIGLGVAIAVYRRVAKEVGPFNLTATTSVAGELRTENKHVDLGGAKSLHTVFKVTQGVLALDAEAVDGFDGSFIYDDADWMEPEIEYTVEADGKGSLVVEQNPTGRPAMRQGKSEWTLHLDKNIPTRLEVKFGAGKASINLSELNLSGLRIENGVGELDLDLSGPLARSLEGFIKTGIGDTTFRLPKNAGVRIHSTMALGSMQAHGLIREGETYTNDLFGKSPLTLDLSIQGGIGKIRLE